MRTRALKPAWRGVVLDDGTIWAWPTFLMDHNQAFSALPLLSDRCRARWRQWSADEPADFDPGHTEEDKALVNAWIERANA